MEENQKPGSRAGDTFFDFISSNEKAEEGQKLPPNPIWLGFIFMTFFDSTWVNFAFVPHVLTCCARCSKKMSLGRKKEGL